MYKLKREDTGKVLIFLDAFSVVPGIGPDTDMDGHNLSDLTYNEEQKLKRFIDNFNEYYANKAECINIMDAPVILVKDFWEDRILSEYPDNISDDELFSENIEDIIKNVKLSWKQIFNLTDNEKEKFEKELRKRLEEKVNA